MRPRSGDGDKSPRIALCHLESLVCLPAINRLFSELGCQIGMVILSRRFDTQHGGLLRQLVENARRSGLRLTLWLGFDIVAAAIVTRVAAAISSASGRAPSLRSVKALAQHYGAKVRETGNINSPEVVEEARRFSPDIVIVMNFDQILRPPFISLAKIAVINIHPSLLPSLRGPCPVLWAMLEDKQKTGVSVHLIENSQIDAGPVLRQSAKMLDTSLSVAEITSALFVEGAKLAKPLVEELVTGRCQLQPQEGNDYRGFPSRQQMATAHKRGIRLWRVNHIFGLMMSAVGFARRQDH